MGNTALRLMWPHDENHTATAFLPPDAADYWIDLTKNSGIDPRHALVVTAAEFKNVCIAITKETKEQVEARDTKNGMQYTRKKFTDWIEEEKNG